MEILRPLVVCVKLTNLSAGRGDVEFMTYACISSALRNDMLTMTKAGATGCLTGVRSVYLLLLVPSLNTDNG